MRVECGQRGVGQLPIGHEPDRASFFFGDLEQGAHWTAMRINRKLPMPDLLPRGEGGGSGGRVRDGEIIRGIAQQSEMGKGIERQPIFGPALISRRSESPGTRAALMKGHA